MAAALINSALLSMRFKTVAFHKPAGLVVTHRDELGRPTAYDALRQVLPASDAADSWHACGRLDQNTSGLLLFTTDGALVRHVTDPTHGGGLVKRYRAQCHSLPSGALEQLRAGVDLGNLGRTLPAEVQLEEDASSSSGAGATKTDWLVISIREGKNRQLRRMLHAVGSGIMRLERQAVGGVELGSLREGEVRFLSAAECKAALNWDATHRVRVAEPPQLREVFDPAEADTAAAGTGRASAYELLDSGDYRRLERWGALTVSRPCPSAGWPRGLPASRWAAATLEYHEACSDDQARARAAGGGGAASARQGEWRGPDLSWALAAAGEEADGGGAAAPGRSAAAPAPPGDGDSGAWCMAASCGVRLGLCPGPSGQLGAFPEQAPNWAWLRAQCERAPPRARGAPLRVLNLFGHTGGSTLACAAADAPAAALAGSADGASASAGGAVEVVHLDGARSAVRRARANAQLSGLGAAPVRWLAEDTLTYVRRAVRRGERFDGLILDPPAFGRGGTKRAEWRLGRDLPLLVELLRELLSDEPAFVLLTCHDAKWPAEQLRAALDDLVRGGTSGSGRAHEAPACEHGQMVLRASEPGGQDLPMGAFARCAWPLRARR